jgi:hypothetical protein
VLELAVEAGCRVVVTHNIRDYAGSEHFGVTAITPGEFLRRIGGSS